MKNLHYYIIYSVTDAGAHKDYERQQKYERPITIELYESEMSVTPTLAATIYEKILTELNTYHNVFPVRITIISIFLLMQ